MEHPITSAALSQIESGKVTPTSQTLRELADALDVPVEFFFAEWDPRGSDDVLAHVPYFRDLAATPAKDRRRAAALALILSILVAAFESRIQLPKLKVPRYDAAPEAGRDDIEDIAQALRGEWDLGDGPIPHVVEEIEKHGVPVARLSLGSERVDAFSVRLDPRPLILLTDDKSNYVRSRFDASHELGHLVMHRSADPDDRRIEHQAHDFASAFLMPSDVARTQLPRRLDSRGWGRLAELKREWGMSMSALLYRSRELRLLTPDAYRNAMKYMSARGWRTTEPGDQQMGLPESPRLFERALILIQDEYDESIQDLARSAHLPVGDAVWLIRGAGDRRPRLHL
jgi:Zn-dependent peptidase ImmA (M78 family)